MDPNELKTLIDQAAQSGEDQGALTSALSKIQTEVDNLFTRCASLTDENKKLTEDNEQLRAYNWDLFKSRGTVVNTGEQGSEKKSEQLKRAETITPEDLFKEEK